MANRAFNATNQLDKVYAVLGMAEARLQAGRISDLREHVDDTIIVDYTATVPVVYQYLAKYMINRDRNLDILCILSTHRGQDSNTLPSWTPDWRVPTTEIGMRECFDYFTEKFGAAGFTEALAQPYNISDILFVAGYFLDEVGTLANLTTSTSHMLQRSTEGQIFTREFQEDKDLRRCGRTRIANLTCLVPRSSRVGDEIWIMYGGRLPFVLRLAESWDPSQDDKIAFESRVGDFECMYEVIGPCCVPGYMYGEAITAAVEQKKEPRLLLLK